MSIYDEMRGVANEVFTEFKQGVVKYVPIVSNAGVSPDEPASSSDGPPVTLAATVQPVSTKYVDGSHIVQSDRQVTFPNDGVNVPKMSGYLLIDDVRYKIIEIMPRPAAGTPVTWTVIARR